MNLREVVKNLSPSWFAVVMGTGILANVSTIFSNAWHPLYVFGECLFVLNIFIFFILLPLWLARWLFYRDSAFADLYDPVKGNFYPTFSIGMLVLASNFEIYTSYYFVSLLFWVLGAVITVLFALMVPSIVFLGEHAEIHHINPSWFIPPVGLIVIPMSGIPLISKYSSFGDGIMLMSIFGFGAGFFLYIALLAVCIYRFALHRPLPPQLEPTVWINLGPIGAGTLSFLTLSQSFGGLDMRMIVYLIIIFWAFGLWWLFMAIIITVHYYKKMELPYSLSWWAFVFPLGAYTAATGFLSKFVLQSVLCSLGMILYFMLLTIWILTSTKTLQYLFKSRHKSCVSTS